MKKIEVAIIGGSFSPPTLSHLGMGSEVLYNFPFIRELWYIPCGSRTDKKVDVSGKDRLAMTQIAVSGTYPETQNIKVLDIEIKHGNMIPTSHLLQMLYKQFQTHNFHYVIGADLLPTLYKWDNPEYLYEQTNFLIFNRLGYQVDLTGKTYRMPKLYKYLESSIIGSISSTEARKKLEEINRDSSLELCKVLSLISKPVLEYIVSNKLYLKE